MNEQNKKVPTVRFKGFTNDWEQRKLGEVILDYKRKNNNDRLPVLTSSFQGIEYQEKHFGSQQKHDTSDYNVLPKEYMTYRNRSDNGYFRFNINNLGVTGIVSKFYPVFTTINTNKLFLASYINHNHRLKNHFKVVSVGTSQHVLSLRNFKKTNLLFPSKDEQDQIGKFFNLLNRAITLQQRKLDLLKQLKKGLLQKMFADKDSKSPVLRFKIFHDDWEQRKLGDISKTKRGLTYKPSNIDNTGIRVLRSSNIKEDTFVISDDDVFVKESAVNIPFVENGDILITAANGSTNLVGKHAIIRDIPKNSAVHGGFMLITTSKEYEFLNALMSSNWYKKFIKKYVAGGNGAIGNLRKNDLDNQKIYVPKKDEQEKIGNFFKMLDSLITLHQRKQNHLKLLKKSLLQQMFM
ncbi:restriction endonuclease subunit S [Limosilactobacillus reuteri]|uniref:restriction endonuclease subunit S n=1 Tax=Limosilactobacillus reuteri TaxID=1598 RepID=UPI003994475E